MSASRASETLVERIALQFRVEQFYFYEAELLDSRAFKQWLELLHPDIRYWLPVRTDRHPRDQSRDDLPSTVAQLDFNRTAIEWRVLQLASSTHWAENPPSRTRHLVTNVRLGDAGEQGQLSVRSNFHCYRNRGIDQIDQWIGERIDLLVPETDSDTFRIRNRRIVLDQSVLLTMNLGVFL